MGTPLAVGASLGDCEGIYLRALGDGQQYIVQLMQGAPLQTSSLPELALGIFHSMPLSGRFLTRHMLLAAPFTSLFGPIQHCGTYCFWKIIGPLLTRPAIFKEGFTTPECGIWWRIIRNWLAYVLRTCPLLSVHWRGLYQFCTAIDSHTHMGL